VGWVKLLEIESLPEGARKVAEGAAAAYGKALNTWRSLFQRPEIFEAYFPFIRSVAGPGVVDDQLKGLSAFYVGWLNNCRYTISHRSTAAKKIGVTDEQLISVALGNWNDFDLKLQLALEYTKQLTLGPAVIQYSSIEGIIEPELRKQISEVLSEPEIVELTMSISLWNALARYHRVMEFEMDMPDAPAQLLDIMQSRPGR